MPAPDLSPDLPPPIPAGAPAPQMVIPYAQPVVQLPFRDRRGGLTAFGVVLILLGALAGCTTLAMPFSLVAIAMVPGGIPGSRWTMVATIVGGTLMYGAIATGLIWLGIASTRCHRYVRPIVLTLAWLSIGVTIVSAIGSIGAASLTRAMATVTFAPTGGGGGGTATTNPAGNAAGVRVQDFSEGAPAVEQPTTALARAATTSPGGGRAQVRVRVPATGPVGAGGPPAPVLAGMTAFMIVWGILLALVGIGVSAVFVWFYQSQDTRLTLEFFDPRPRWTDGRPVPVIAVVITLAIVGLGAPVVILQQAAITGVGDGGRAALVIGALYATCAVVALAAIVPAYRARPIGWAMAMAVVLIGGAAVIAGVFLGDPTGYMRQWAAIDVAALRDAIKQQRPWQIAAVSVWILGAFGYLLWARRYFGDPAAPATPPVSRPA